MACQSLNIKTRTWERDSYGLFDYEAKNIQISKLDLKEACTIFRKDCQISMNKCSKSNESDINAYSARRQSSATDYESLAIIKREKGEFVLYKGNEEYSNIYQVLQLSQPECKKEICLKEGDLFKLGRISFKVLKV